MPERNEKVIALNVRLSPVGSSDQPVCANYTTVGVAQGIAYLDFAFIDPGELGKVIRGVQAGQPAPERLNGKLAVRVALGLDVLQRLERQIQQVMTEIRSAAAEKR